MKYNIEKMFADFTDRYQDIFPYSGLMIECIYMKDLGWEVTLHTKEETKALPKDLIVGHGETLERATDNAIIMMKLKTAKHSQRAEANGI